jgi:hypothetical protein
MHNNENSVNDVKIGLEFKSVGFLVLLLLLGLSLIIPATVGQKGWQPTDDALRHAAKAISGKSWDQILVVRQDIHCDVHHGWHIMLGFLHRTLHLDQHSLLVFQVTVCFFLFTAVPSFFKKRPEAWYLALLVMALADMSPIYRIFYGRPFIMSSLLLAIIAISWKSFAGKKTLWRNMAAMTAGFVAITWLHPSPYLFVYPLACFFIARQWQAAWRLTVCFLAGSTGGFLLTGHPIEMFRMMLYLIFHAPDQSLLTRMLVTEFQPRGGLVLSISVVLFFLIWRFIRGKLHSNLLEDPVFLIFLAGIFLGHIVGRFWTDWGFVAATVWITAELEDVLEKKYSKYSIKRFGSVAVIALGMYVIFTADTGSRWSSEIPRFNPDLSTAAENKKEWYPDSGGIVYSDNMGIFYRMFFWNPHANWRYMLGFEPVFMPEEDLKVYREIQRMSGNVESWEPWLKRMKRQDRIIFFSDKQPQKPDSMQWGELNKGIWAGRLIR